MPLPSISTKSLRQWLPALIATSISTAGADNQSFGSWTVPDAENHRANPVSKVVDSINAGQLLYQHYCVACHGQNADGKSISAGMIYPPPANLRAISGRYSDGNLAYKIRTGRNMMPDWEQQLSETEIWHLVNFIQSLASR